MKAIETNARGVTAQVMGQGTSVDTYGERCVAMLDVPLLTLCVQASGLHIWARASESLVEYVKI